MPNLKIRLERRRNIMSTTDEFGLPLTLTQARRRLVAEFIPHLTDRLKIEEAASRTIRFTSQEVQHIVAACQTAIQKATKRKVQDSLQYVVDAATLVLEQFREGGVARIPVAERLYQFKITLRGIEPPIWRRIQTKDCTLDRLHEHIQTAMGWTNSHLHSFCIREQLYGDPMLLQGNFDEMDYADSTTTRLSTVVSKSGESFRFDYEYDFGDRWKHSVLFEGCVRASKGTRYPTCLEGERACPPEDVGGVRGYQEYLTTLSNPEHKEWEETSEWRGPYRPEQFDAEAATKAMRRGLPNWRKKYEAE